MAKGVRQEGFDSSLITKDSLSKLCTNMTTKELAVHFKCGVTTIRRALLKYNLRSVDIRKSGNFQTGEANPFWKGGRYRKPNGYIMVRVGKNHYRREHILIMEEFIGRELYKSEVVHHLNGIPDDNRVENLVVMNKRDHDRYHSLFRELDKGGRFYINNKGYINDTIFDIINRLYPELSNELKMYAELTRIVKC